MLIIEGIADHRFSTRDVKFLRNWIWDCFAIEQIRKDASERRQEEGKEVAQDIYSLNLPSKSMRLIRRWTEMPGMIKI